MRLLQAYQPLVASADHTPMSLAWLPPNVARLVEGCSAIARPTQLGREPLFHGSSVWLAGQLFLQRRLPRSLCRSSRWSRFGGGRAHGHAVVLARFDTCS